MPQQFQQPGQGRMMNMAQQNPTIGGRRPDPQPKPNSDIPAISASWLPRRPKTGENAFQQAGKAPGNNGGAAGGNGWDAGSFETYDHFADENKQKQGGDPHRNAAFKEDSVFDQKDDGGGFRNPAFKEGNGGAWPAVQPYQNQQNKNGQSAGWGKVHAAGPQGKIDPRRNPAFKETKAASRSQNGGPQQSDVGDWNLPPTQKWGQPAKQESVGNRKTQSKKDDADKWAVQSKKDGVDNWTSQAKKDGADNWTTQSKKDSAPGWNNTSKENDGNGWEEKPPPSFRSHRAYSDGKKQDTDPETHIKSYWKGWNKAPVEREASEVDHTKKPTEPREVYKYPASPLPKVPADKARDASHGIQGGKGADYSHLCRRPIYIDTMESPYAVFSFKYRSKEALERILKMKIDGLDVQKIKDDVEKDKYLSMPKHQLVEELMNKRTPQKAKSGAASASGSKKQENGWGGADAGNAKAPSGAWGSQAANEGAKKDEWAANNKQNDNDGGWGVKSQTHGRTEPHHSSRDQARSHTNGDKQRQFGGARGWNKEEEPAPAAVGLWNFAPASGADQPAGKAWAADQKGPSKVVTIDSVMW
ncbi:hypothetical protein LTR37_013856 [Vermiconidia calcicola]|uniref:Uncharacterized protein n=1 Tax=Vermiconidia calcicola TaxID=1690605 RepID=A0ACC3MVD9_9PEZI|nr:hypothetical protein LTR37_013856 [Vermiconidia calcicola]